MGVDTGEGSSAVAFEAGVAFQGVEDGFDPLADAADVPEPWFLVFAVGSDQVMVPLEHRLDHFPLPDLRVCQRPEHRQREPVCCTRIVRAGSGTCRADG